MHKPQLFISTKNLLLRSWQDSDTAPFILLNSDPEVMEFFPSVLQPAETISQIIRIQKHFADYGYGFFAVERKDNHQFIGFTGFSHPAFDSFFTPCVEIGWRYSKQNWGHGFATEAAAACMEYGFQQLGLQEIFAFTSAHNKRSELVMQRTGMQFTARFAHPLLEQGHQLSPHLLYKKQHENNAGIRHK